MVLYRKMSFMKFVCMTAFTVLSLTRIQSTYALLVTSSIPGGRQVGQCHRLLFVSDASSSRPMTNVRVSRPSRCQRPGSQTICIGPAKIAYDEARTSELILRTNGRKFLAKVRVTLMICNLMKNKQPKYTKKIARCKQYIIEPNSAHMLHRETLQNGMETSHVSLAQSDPELE